MRPPHALALLVLLAVAPAAAKEVPQRAAVDPPAESGWQRLVLPLAAERELASVWIADAAGRAVPYLLAERAALAPWPVALTEMLLGVDEPGQAMAEFTPRLPKGSPAVDAPTLRLTFEVSGETPWIARLEVERRRAGGDWIALAGEAIWLDDLGDGRRHVDAELPWDGERYRIRLVPFQGGPLALTEITATGAPAATPGPEDVALAATLAPGPAADGQAIWTVTLPHPDRVAALEIALAPPAAPLAAEVRRPPEPGERAGRLLGSATLWDLPALGAHRRRVEVRPALVERLELHLPAGARPLAVTAHVRRSVLVFPAEAGQRLSLRWGGVAERPPGDLAALDRAAPGLEAYRRPPLAVGAPEPDPDARRRVATLGERLRPALVPVVVLLALALATIGWRLFRAGAAQD